MKILKSLFKDGEDGIILFTLMMLSMVFLALGLTLLYQADTNFQMSAVTRDNVEVFMTAETAYDVAVSRMITMMDSGVAGQSFRSAQPDDPMGWPNYLVRVYDDTFNPSAFRLVEMPTANWWSDDVANRSLSGAPDVTDDNSNPDAFLITRQESQQLGNQLFKVSGFHSYRVWLEADRLLDENTDDRTAFIMVESFKGNPSSSIDPNDPNFLPQSHVLMQYRVRVSKNTIGWENEDDSGTYGAGRTGSGASVSGGLVTIPWSGTPPTRSMTP